jgi:hypothetical protein
MLDETVNLMGLQGAAIVVIFFPQNEKLSI